MPLSVKQFDLKTQYNKQVPYHIGSIFAGLTLGSFYCDSKQQEKFKCCCFPALTHLKMINK